jgi:hypothetical protein
LVFIARSERARLPAILAQLRDSRALLVSDIEDFAAQGGIIGMDKQGTRLHLSINLRNAEQAGLEIKARMLSLKNVRLLGRPVGGAPS